MLQLLLMRIVEDCNALALLTLPVVIVATEDGLARIPLSLRESIRSGNTGRNIMAGCVTYGIGNDDRADFSSSKSNR